MNKVVTTIAPTRPLRSLTDMKDDLSIIKELRHTVESAPTLKNNPIPSIIKLKNG